MSGIIALALYRPKEGKTEELKRILHNHIPTLREEVLITEREVIAFQAEDGTLIEVLEWRSEQAIEQAHQSVKVMAVWDQIGEVAELTSFSTLSEAQHPFPNFQPVSL